jgi:hypothetical protein
MDCCGMPMAAWPGGGLVCVRCQAKVGVPWFRDRNRAARCMENPPMDDMATVVEEPAGAPVSFPVGEPKVSGFGRGVGRKGGPK